MTDEQQDKTEVKRTLRLIIQLLDEEIERMDADREYSGSPPDPARRPPRPHELN
jgi:hypothetical protein